MQVKDFNLDRSTLVVAIMKEVTCYCLVELLLQFDLQMLMSAGVSSAEGYHLCRQNISNGQEMFWVSLVVMHGVLDFIINTIFQTKFICNIIQKCGMQIQFFPYQSTLNVRRQCQQVKSSKMGMPMTYLYQSVVHSQSRDLFQTLARALVKHGRICILEDSKQTLSLSWRA